MIDKYILFLMLGHILGDFYFQKGKGVLEKEIKYIGVVKHSLEYLLIMVILTIPVLGLDMFLAAIYASIFHWLIDTIKYVLLMKKKINNNYKTFVFAQFAHIISILILAYIMMEWNFQCLELNIIKNISDMFNFDMMYITKWILKILLIHSPANIFIQKILVDYRPQSQNEENIITTDKKAGRMIGTIERLIMLILLDVNQYGALGLVLTAKSIARYEKITKDEMFAEYYLLGTLISTLYVLVCNMIIF